MAKGYWLAQYLSIRDPEKLKKYAETVTPIIQSFGGRALVRGGKFQVLSGKNFLRTVIWEFDTYSRAMECHDSQKYQEGWDLAKESTERNLLIIEGVS